MKKEHFIYRTQDGREFPVRVHSWGPLEKWKLPLGEYWALRLPRGTLHFIAASPKWWAWVSE